MSAKIHILRTPRFTARKVTVNPNGTTLLRYKLERETDLRPLLSQQVVLNGRRYLVRGLEYPNLRRYIDAMREDKTEQNAESLAARWEVEQATALTIARQLRDIGFFGERNSAGQMTFWVPFVYRPYLSMSQGKVDEI